MTECVHWWRVGKLTTGFYVGARCKKKGCGAIRVFPADSDVRSGWRTRRKKKAETRSDPARGEC